MAKIVAVCTSEITGVRKNPVASGVLETDFGVKGDAHADRNTHRQVSLLAIESIDKMRDQGYDVNPGDFGENLTTRGIEVHSLPVGTRLTTGDGIVLEITQIGKECHTGCAIFQQTGKCIMPKEGVFATVIHGGTVRPDDGITVTESASV